MIEPNDRIAEQYQALSEFLMNNVDFDKTKVDKETIESIIDACCDFNQSDNTRSSLVIPDLTHPDQSVSVKFSNIRFGFKMALDMISLVPTKPLSSEMEIIKFIVGIMKFTVNHTAEDINVEETKIIRQLCMLDYDGSGVPESLLRANTENIDEKKFNDAVKKLKELNCISEHYEDIDGKTEKVYNLIENVLLNIK